MATAPRSGIIILALAAALQPLPAQGFEYRAGFGGTAVPGRFAPFLWRGDAVQADGTVELALRDADGRDAAVIEAPYLAGPWLSFALPWPAAEGAAARLAAGAFILSETPLAGAARSWAGHLALAVGLDAGARSALARALEPLERVAVASLSAESLPASPLAFDGATVLAIRETGERPSAARLRAISAWLASGGTLAVLGAEDGGLADSLAPGIPAEAASSPEGWSARSVGFGRLTALAGIAADTAATSDPAAWGAWLALQPYERRRSLDPWPELSPGVAGRPEWQSLLRVDGLTLIVSLAWAALAIIAIAFPPRRRLACALAAAAVFLGLAALGAERFSPANPEASVRARVMVLPGGAGAWLSLAGIPADLPSRAGIGWLAAERRLRVSLRLSEKASGELLLSTLPDEPPRLRLDAGSSDLSLRRVDPTGVELAAWLPPDALSSMALPGFSDAGSGKPPVPVPPAGASGRLAWLAPGPGQAWSEWNAGTGTWEALGQAPAWLGDDLAWAIRSHAATPDIGFLAGIGSAPGGIAAGGLAIGRAAWVIPWGSRIAAGAEGSP